MRKGIEKKTKAELTENEFREQKLLPLKVAAEQIAELICRLSSDSEIFVSESDTPATRKVDTKTLKEFSAVIKELSSVICELNGISPEDDSQVPSGVRIEFESEALKASE